ncbi:MAG: M20/M25/M40 family metallo-hydrolase, partial [Gammaproteobacteria bacterium]
HNWWGNSVFVDYDSGNWCEGLTAYMADHLIQEQRGTGAAYRRDTLKKYRDFVKEDRDFPLTEFRSRHSAATEAIGYGKTLMGFHMLRLQLGDELFKRALARFYRTNRGRQASFADVRAALEAESDRDFGAFFEQWIEWTGAADLAVDGVEVRQSGDRYSISGTLVQAQEGTAYNFDVPVIITTAAGVESTTVALTAKRTDFEITTAATPLLLEVDPQFDVFRLLDPKETAPSIGQIFGEPEILAVMPADADPELLAGYRELAQGWNSDVHAVTIVEDTDIDAIPADKAAWLFGRNNRLARSLFGSDPTLDLKISPAAVITQGQEIPLQDHSAVLVKRHPDNAARAIGWIFVDPVAAIPGIGGKLPHYGKYSFLGFAGDEPANMVKGEWVATDSPLRVDLRPAEDRTSRPVQRAALPRRVALAEIPPVFSRERLLEHIDYLAADELGGRGLGTPGLETAAAYIAGRFEAAGLAAAGDNDGYRQTFRVDEGEDGKPHEVANIVGMIPGSNTELAGQAVLVTAHYDHLGHGWPDVRAADRGKIYNGADDNASGVSILIELANVLAEEPAPERSIVFVAFTGEEAGLLGSRYYADHPVPVPLEGIIGVVNMDTIGRLEGRDISVFGAGSASEWQHIFRGIGFSAGIGSKSITGDFASSDHQSFIDKGIPGVQISSGANLDYHRPTDTVDKIDAAGMVKAAMFVKETVAYLAQREEPLTVTIDDSARTPAPAAASGAGRERRVSVGTVPDFAFQGPGIRVDAVVPGSPAAAAGIEAGDVLTGMAGRPIANLQGFTDLLKSLSPGDTVPVDVQRDGRGIDLEVTVTAR